MEICKIRIIFFILVIFICAAFNANAANLNYSADTNISISPLVSFIVSAGSKADSLTINSTGIVVILSNLTGGSFILSSAATGLLITPSSEGGTVVQSCVSGVANVSISQTTGSSTYTIEPSGSQCVSDVAQQTVIGGAGGNAIMLIPQKPTVSDLVKKPEDIQLPVNPIMSDVFTKSLKFGSNEKQVILLQNLLKKLGFISKSVKSNGNFGPVTLKAVQSFQIKYKIAKKGAIGFGQVGPNTRRELNKLNK